MYKMSFAGLGCYYSRSFDSKEERDKFAEEMRKAGYRVQIWDLR